MNLYFKFKHKKKGKIVYFSLMDFFCETRHPDLDCTVYGDWQIEFCSLDEYNQNT